MVVKSIGVYTRMAQSPVITLCLISDKSVFARQVLQPIVKVLVLWTFVRTFGQVGQMARVVINEQV